jgi:hypothetical protein
MFSDKMQINVSHKCIEVINNESKGFRQILRIKTSVGIWAICEKQKKGCRLHNSLSKK